MHRPPYTQAIAVATTRPHAKTATGWSACREWRASRATPCEGEAVATFAWGRELLPRRLPGYTGVSSSSEHHNSSEVAGTSPRSRVVLVVSLVTLVLVYLYVDKHSLASVLQTFQCIRVQPLTDSIRAYRFAKNHALGGVSSSRTFVLGNFPKTKTEKTSRQG